MSVLFLFGAGASFGSGPCTPTNPPLGRDLIVRMRDEGGIAATIEGDLLDTFIADPEEGMVRFFEERNKDTTELLKQMCAYLAKFSIDKDNLYIKLFDILKKRKNICFATTNYDTLIEQAVSSAGYLVQYTSSNRFKKNIPVLKIHGSINFIPSAIVSGISFEIATNDNSAIYEGPLDIYNNLGDIIRYCKSDTSFSPAVSLYHPQKKVLHSPSFINKIQEEFHTEINKSSKIFIIGLKINPNDTHIWNKLEETKSDIYIIDRDRELTINWKNKTNKKNIYHIADSFEESVMIIKNILQL
ncbi:TPA: SIR2 family protein [Klebsiella pneumoniae]|nr:SIR2 family protein [Klebsiella pneumoniae]HBR4253403.1 SIR2 family protein [Klebsiella pneumoniae]HDZ2196860.1 SIR2 family protein [Klebsiella pneumoniae]